MTLYRLISPLFYVTLYMSITSIPIGLLTCAVRRLASGKLRSYLPCVMWIVTICFLVIPIASKSALSLEEARRALLSPEWRLRHVETQMNYYRFFEKALVSESYTLEQQGELVALEEDLQIAKGQAVLFEGIIPDIWLGGILVAAFPRLYLSLTRRRKWKKAARSAPEGDRLNALARQAMHMTVLPLQSRPVWAVHDENAKGVSLHPGRMIVVGSDSLALKDAQLAGEMTLALSRSSAISRFLRFLCDMLIMFYWYQPFTKLFLRDAREDFVLGRDQLTASAPRFLLKLRDIQAFFLQKTRSLANAFANSRPVRAIVRFAVPKIAKVSSFTVKVAMAIWHFPSAVSHGFKRFVDDPEKAIGDFVKNRRAAHEARLEAREAKEAMRLAQDEDLAAMEAAVREDRDRRRRGAQDLASERHEIHAEPVGSASEDQAEKEKPEIKPDVIHNGMPGEPEVAASEAFDVQAGTGTRTETGAETQESEPYSIHFEQDDLRSEAADGEIPGDQEAVPHNSFLDDLFEESSDEVASEPASELASEDLFEAHEASAGSPHRNPAQDPGFGDDLEEDEAAMTRLDESVRPGFFARLARGFIDFWVKIFGTIAMGFAAAVESVRSWFRK